MQQPQIIHDQPDGTERKPNHFQLQLNKLRDDLIRSSFE